MYVVEEALLVQRHKDQDQLHVISMLFMNYIHHIMHGVTPFCYQANKSQHTSIRKSEKNTCEK